MTEKQRQTKKKNTSNSMFLWNGITLRNCVNLWPNGNYCALWKITYGKHTLETVLMFQFDFGVLRLMLIHTKIIVQFCGKNY